MTMAAAFTLTFITKMNETSESQIPDLYGVARKSPQSYNTKHTANAQRQQQAVQMFLAFL